MINKAIKRFSKMPLYKLRQYQRLNEIQIQWAHIKKREDVLSRLHKMSSILAAAVDRKEFS